MSSGRVAIFRAVSSRAARRRSALLRWRELLAGALLGRVAVRACVGWLLPLGYFLVGAAALEGPSSLPFGADHFGVVGPSFIPARGAGLLRVPAFDSRGQIEF